MELVKNNINVNAQSFLEGLVLIENIESYDFNYIQKTLTLQVNENWSTQNLTNLDTLITDETIVETYKKVISTNVVINSIRELRKKVSKDNSIKNKVQIFDYNKTTKELICFVDIDWSEQDTNTLDTIIDALVGYDVVTQIQNNYNPKISDGVAYYNLKRAEEVEKITNGFISSLNAFEIAKKIKEVKSELLTGDWITAFRYIVATEINTIYTQEVKDEYQNYIENYVNLNYDNGSFITQGILNGTF
jgi:hypothetical protein